MKKLMALMLAVTTFLTIFAGCQKVDVAEIMGSNDETYPEVDNGPENLLIKQIYNDDGLADITVFYTPDGLVGGFYESEYNAEGKEIRRFLYDADCNLLAITHIDENGDDLGFEVADSNAGWHCYQLDENGYSTRTEYYEGQELMGWTDSIRNEKGHPISATDKDGTMEFVNYYNEFGQWVRWEEKSGAFSCEMEYDSEGRKCKETTFGREEQILSEYEFVYSFSEQVETVNIKSDGSYYTSHYSVFDASGRSIMTVVYGRDGSFFYIDLYLYNILDPTKAISLVSYEEPRVIPGLMQDTPVAGVETEERPVVTSGIKKPSYAYYVDVVDSYNVNGLKAYETTSHKNPDRPGLEMLEEYKLMKTGAQGEWAYMSIYYADYKDVNAAFNDNYSYYGWSTPRTGGVYNSYTQGWTENQEFQYYEIDSDDGYILSYLVDDVVLTVSCYPELKNDARAIMYDILTGN